MLFNTNKYLLLLVFLTNSLFGTNTEKTSGSDSFLKAQEEGTPVDDVVVDNHIDVSELLKAVQDGNSQAVSSFLKSNIHVDSKGEYGFTPLHIAARAGHVDVMEVLLAAGANLQSENRNNNSPLHCAAYGNQANAVEFLVSKDAQLEARNKDGDTPLHSAAWKNCPSAIEALLAKGADIEARNNEGDTPLHLAAWNNSIAALNVLVAKGARVDAKNNDEETPIDLAQKRDNALTIEILSNVQRFAVLLPKIQELVNRLINKSENLQAILSDYQTYDVTEYEIERSIRTLRSLHENAIYLGIGKTIDSAAIMLPSNLPLYSLVIFALIPSLLCQQVDVRPNSLLQETDIVTRIYDELELENLFAGVSIRNTDHAGFKQYLKNASLVVFTGNPNNAETILADLKEGAILVLNGSGHNPVVVTDTANIDEAVEGTLLVKGFNGGQDCAGPDAILVHHSIAKEFIEQFNRKFSSLKIGQFTDQAVRVGPIHRLSELQKFAQIFYNNRNDIVLGGTIDFKNRLVYPTTIVRGIERYPNYKEMFGPVAFIHPYKEDSDLAYYFQDADGQYNANRMYVTVYGHSDYMVERDDAKNPYNPGNVGIILQNKTIHDVEIGFKAYGGYSLGASGLIKKTSTGLQKVAMPVLIPEVISNYLVAGKELPRADKARIISGAFTATASIKKGKEIDPIIADFQAIATDVFGSNLIFGFIFGSAAKGKLRVQGPDRDDLDTFICLDHVDESAVTEYLRRLERLHSQYNLKVDNTFPAEIMTLEKLQRVINSIDAIEISIDKIVGGEEFDKIFWVHALTDKKVGFVGNGKLMSCLIKSSLPFIAKWRNQIIEQLQEIERLPEHITQKFSGLTRQEIVGKLSQYNPHLVVHLGLKYDDGNNV